MEQDTHTTVRLPVAAHRRLREIAEAEHRTVSGEVRRVLLAHIAQYDAQSEAAA